MVCGYGDSVSYEQLVNDLAKARIDKSSRFTDWSRRPLTEAQLSLRPVGRDPSRHGLRGSHGRSCTSSGRIAWLDEEMAVLTSPETYRADPDNAWRRLVGRLRKAARGRRAHGGRRLARARGAEPRRAARPRPEGRRRRRSRSRRRRAASEALGRLRSIPNGFERSRTAADILEAVERGTGARSQDAFRCPTGSRRGGATGAVVELLKVLLKAVAEQEGRRAQDHRDRRGSRGDRRERRRGRARAAWLAPPALRREGARPEGRRARARDDRGRVDGERIWPDRRTGRCSKTAQSHRGLIAPRPGFGIRRQLSACIKT